jgi:hypothetical protein
MTYNSYLLVQTNYLRETIVRKKDPNQFDLFNISFAQNFPDNLKPYAYDILKKLYIESGGLNISQAYNLFNNRKNIKVRETLDNLSNCDYNFIVLDKTRCRGAEKRYFLTEYGEKALTEHYRNK